MLFIALCNPVLTSRQAKKDKNWKEIQVATFERWANLHLKKRGVTLDDLYSDFRNGVKLVQLVEQVSKVTLGDYFTDPQELPECVFNIRMALDYLQDEGVLVIPIDRTLILNGSKPMTLSLLWCLILEYTMREGDESWKCLMTWVCTLFCLCSRLTHTSTGPISDRHRHIQLYFRLAKRQEHCPAC